MKNYFPFTDYDFYAYLTSGALFLAVMDFVFNDASLLMQSDWTFIQIVLAFAAAYITGHITATFAQLVIETFIVSNVISKPITLQLGLKPPNFMERMLGVLVGRYYEPLDASVQEKIKEGARTALSLSTADRLSAEDVFQAGFRRSFSIEGSRSRIDSFLNQYGFCRNISFISLVVTIIIGWKVVCTEVPHGGLAISISAVVFAGMFVRFVKFYSSFQSEVIRCLLK